MPWQNCSEQAERLRFVCTVHAARATVAECCRRFQINRRRYRGLPPPRGYPASWATVWINREGRAWWAQRQRLFGVAFAHQWLGLRPTAPGQWHVYLDHILIGLLVAKDRAGMRPLQLRAHQSGEGFALPCTPPHHH
jgi:hypothetical protein